MAKEKMPSREISLTGPELVENVMALKQELNDMLMSSSAFKTALARAYLSIDIVEASPMQNSNIRFPLNECEITVSKILVDRGWTFQVSKRTLFESQLKSTWDPLGNEFGSENIFLNYQRSGAYPNYSLVGEIAYSRISLNGRLREDCKNSQVMLEKMKKFMKEFRRDIKIDNLKP